MNRNQRRAAQSVHKKEVKKFINSGDWGLWQDITNDFHAKMEGRFPELHRMKKYLKNNIYTAQVIETKYGDLIGIRRHDQSTDIPWAHKQRIKNEVIGEDIQAIEVFPAKSQLVDGANMYWLWVMNVNVSLNDALKGIYA